MLQISPLKALINDQYQRLEIICERLDIPVIPWHGDSAASNKAKFFKSPRGIVLITPESLEAMFVNKGGRVPEIFKHLQHVVIDELHAFIGTERGRQLQSLLQRLETAIGRPVPRVGLSATLGDMNLAGRFLRESPAVEIIESSSGGGKLLLSLKAYRKAMVQPKVELTINLDESLEPTTHNLDEENELEDAPVISDIAHHIYKHTKDSKNLIFPNSRQLVEYYADALRALCEQEGRPNCYWPHHGSLSKDLREDVEGYLKNPEIPANGVCTSTLEMGIDIGDVKSVAQIGRPGSVASLRQRLGRSGRKQGVPSILRAYTMCKVLDAKSTPIDMLHPDLLLTIAAIQLLIRGWFEPPKSNSLHLSTLVHQTLSSIAQYSSRTAVQLWNDLIANGPHKGLTKAEFRDIIIFLGQKDLIMQDADGSFLLAGTGEALVNHYEFYTVFPLTDEYRIEFNGRLIGTLNKENLLAVGQKILFAGQRWKILAVRDDVNVIEVERARGGSTTVFGGESAGIHDEVIAEVRRILSCDDKYQYLDTVANEALSEARAYYWRAQLEQNTLLPYDGNVYIFTWTGDAITKTLAYLLSQKGVGVKMGTFYLIASSTSLDTVLELLEEIRAEENLEPVFEELVPPEFNRWDWAIPIELRRKDFISRVCNLDGLSMLLNTYVY